MHPNPNEITINYIIKHLLAWIWDGAVAAAAAAMEGCDRERTTLQKCLRVLKYAIDPIEMDTFFQN